jgi:hypothetical protein
MNELQEKVRELLDRLTDNTRLASPGWMEPVIEQLQEMDALAEMAPIRTQALAEAGRRELKEHVEAYQQLRIGVRSLSKSLTDAPDSRLTDQLLQHATAIHGLACGYAAVKRALTVPKCVRCGKPAVQTDLGKEAGVKVSFCAEHLKQWEHILETHCDKCEQNDMPLDEHGLCPRCSEAD